MAKKKIRVLYDSQLTLTLTILAAILFFLDFLILKGKLSASLLTSYGTLSDKAFSASNPLSYIRIILHVFGVQSWSALLINSTFFLLLGKSLEEEYGSFILGLMIFLSSLLSGVILIFCPVNSSGAYPIIFLMIFLSAVKMISKKNIQISWILIFILYTAYSMACAFENNSSLIEGNNFIKFFQSNIPTFIAIASGIAASLFGFLSVPKESRSSKKADSFEEKNKKSDDQEGETIGSLKF